MTPIVSLVQTTTYDFTPAHLRLPTCLWTAFTALNKLHGVWRWYRRIELYRHPDNLVQLMAGHVVNLVIGEALILRLAAQCLLVAKRVLACVQQQSDLCQAGQRWLLAFKGHYPRPVKVSWEKEAGYSCLSPITIHWWKTTAIAFWQRIDRLARGTLGVCHEAFKLSMCIMDVIDACCWSPATRHEGIHEGFVNITKWLDTTVQHKEKLLAGISANQALIERLLQGSVISYAQLHTGVSTALAKTETIQRGIKKISTIGGGVLVDMGKQAVNGSLVVMGLANCRPLTLAKV